MCTYGDFDLDKQITQTATFNAVSGQTYVLYNYTAIYTSRESTTPLAEAKAKILAAKTSGYTAALNAHLAAMNDFWKTDIIISGANTAAEQKVMRSFLFNLHQNIRDDSKWSIPPMGLYRDAWNGHLFWDAEIWMYPSVLLTRPGSARSMLEYRYGTLSGAKEIATNEGYQGAQFAWESGYSGRECAPAPYNKEEHITGDIPLALWKQFLFTRDTSWLSTQAYPLIVAAADFWASRSVKRNNRYEILQVMPPDEEAGVIDNCVYTNAIAAKTLRLACSVCDTLHRKKHHHSITVSGLEQNASVELYDVRGRQLFSQSSITTSGTNIIRSIPQGCYVLRVVSGSKIVQRSFAGEW